MNIGPKGLPTMAPTAQQTSTTMNTCQNRHFNVDTPRTRILSPVAYPAAVMMGPTSQSAPLTIPDAPRDAPKMNRASHAACSVKPRTRAITSRIAQRHIAPTVTRFSGSFHQLNRSNETPCRLPLVALSRSPDLDYKQQGRRPCPIGTGSLLTGEGSPRQASVNSFATSPPWRMRNL
jgi:hypothetical protein